MVERFSESWLPRRRSSIRLGLEANASRPLSSAAMKSVRKMLVIRLTSVAGFAGAQTPIARAPAGAASSEASATIDVEHAGAQRIYRLPQRVKLEGSSACPTAHTIRVQAASPAERLGEPALLEQALRTGKPLKLIDVRYASGFLSALSRHRPCSLPPKQGRSRSRARYHRQMRTGQAVGRWPRMGGGRCRRHADLPRIIFDDIGVVS